MSSYIEHDTAIIGAVSVRHSMSTLAERWRIAREEAGLASARALDAAIGQGKSGGYSSRIEAGEKLDPKLDVIRRAAGVLGVRPAWLAFGDGLKREPADFQRIASMRAAAFLNRLLKLRKLEATVVAGTWTLWEVASLVDDLLQHPTLATKDGDPTRGTWTELLEEKARGRPSQTVGALNRFHEIRTEQAREQAKKR